MRRYDGIAQAGQLTHSVGYPINHATHEFVEEQYSCWNERLRPELAEQGIRVLGIEELDDAALIDGCSHLGALFRVIMPLALPGLLAIFLLTFVNVWNEFLAGYLLVSNNKYKPVMFGLYNFLGQNIINLQVIGAACILISLPIVIIFLIFRRSFILP